MAILIASTPDAATSKTLELLAGAMVELVLAAVAIGVLYRIWGRFFPVPRRQIVQAFQRGVVVRDGQPQSVLSPGSYWITPKRTLLLCDMRPTPFQVQAQELVSGDGMGVRISLGGEYRIVNPASFVTESSDAFGVLFLELRHALRVAVGELHSQNFLAGHVSVTERMKELLIPRASHLGIEMTKLEVWEAVPIGWLRPL